MEEAAVALHTLDRALNGDRAAMRVLVDRLSPVIWSRVTRVAMRAGRRTPDQIRSGAHLSSTLGI